MKNEKINLEMAEFKQNMLSNLEENYLEQYPADMGKVYMTSEMDIQIKDFLDSDEYKKELEKEIDNRIKYEGSYLSKEDLKERYDIKNSELPDFKIFTESGLAYSSDNSRTDEYAEKELYQKLETYKYAQGKRPDFNDIKEIAELVNFDKISNVKDGMQLYYENNYGDLKEYTDYDDYTDELVKEVLISKLYDKVEPLKKEIESIIEMRKNPVEIYSNEYIKEGNLENLENKYKEIVEKLEQKEEPTKQNEELEKENKKDKEREF